MTCDAVGGVWQYSIDLIAGLARHGVEVLLANFGPRPSKTQRSLFARFQNAHLAEADFALEWTRDPWQEVDRAKDWLLDLAGEFHPDVIHLNGYTLADAFSTTPVISIAHSCVFSWWEAVHGCQPGPEWDEYHRRVTLGLNRSDAVVAPSRSMAHSVILHYGVDQAKISVIPNFSLAQPSSISEKQPYVLAAGRMWDKAKNLVLLDSIAPDITWPLLVAGNCQVRGSDLLTGSISHLGELTHDDLIRRMEGAAIFVHPALYEPFGLAVLEAARSGCCLVLSDIPSLRELWEGAAVFLDPRNAKAWSDELNRLISAPAERDHLAAQAFTRAQSYNADASVSQYLKTYQSAMAYKRAGSGVAA